MANLKLVFYIYEKDQQAHFTEGLHHTAIIEMAVEISKFATSWRLWDLVASFVLSALRLNISIGIVAMVNWTAVKSDIPESARAEECKYTDAAVRREREDGPFLWDPYIQGHILSCYFYGLSATQLLGGRMAELVSAKYVLLIGTVLATIANTLIPVVASSFAVGYPVMALQVFKGCGQNGLMSAMPNIAEALILVSTSVVSDRLLKKQVLTATTIRKICVCTSNVKNDDNKSAMIQIAGIIMPAFSVLMGKMGSPTERARFMSVISSGMPVEGFLRLSSPDYSAIPLCLDGLTSSTCSTACGEDYTLWFLLSSSESSFLSCEMKASYTKLF
ncbi:inorganic phosphate cotransporter [Caerostris extrusa]|uniref:Inorganic phosphate cotransporter n=1 Tax=Caerostris extrusa TaxID=172846 RepID=A0AAV4PDG8_CAEEX|nr:inorganic phosphate cotransporter [Caerostris extrusa]